MNTSSSTTRTRHEFEPSTDSNNPSSIVRPKKKKKIQEREGCPICMEPVSKDAMKVVCCNLCIHRLCMQQLFEQDMYSCPACRADWSDDEVMELCTRMTMSNSIGGEGAINWLIKPYLLTESQVHERLENLEGLGWTNRAKGVYRRRLQSRLDYLQDNPN